MQHYNDLYQHVKIISDEYNHAVNLGLVERIGDDRKTKIKNNFIGLTEPADSSLLRQLSESLHEKIGSLNETVVVGMYKSGIVVATSMGMVRQSRFAWTTPDKINQPSIVFSEDHRSGTRHYLYGLKYSDKVLLIEDEVTSGKGLSGLALRLHRSGIQIVGIACYLETINFSGREYIKQKTGFDLVSLIRVELS